MGDRCYLTLTINGHIGSIKAAEEIAGALITNFGISRDDFIKEMIESLDKPHPCLVFEDDECNYAQIEETEQTLQEHKVDFEVHHGPGGNYLGGYRAYHSSENAMFENVCDDGDAIIWECTLRDLLKKPEPLRKIRELLDEIGKAKGKNLGPLSLAHEIKGWLLIGAPDMRENAQ